MIEARSPCKDGREPRRTREGYSTYLWVRTDIPPADQIVQAAHAAQEAGGRWGVPGGCRLVVFAVEGREALQAAREFCELRNVPTVVFDEPDPVAAGGEPMGHTALCTAPLPNEARTLFRRFRLWRC